MASSRKTFLFFFLRLFPALLVVVIPGRASAAGYPDAPGRDVLMTKCFQCHNDGMWRDHRQDRRGWEATLYRMVGRGALWKEEEIKTMADYLGVAFGPQAAKTTGKAPQQQGRAP